MVRIQAKFQARVRLIRAEHNHDHHHHGGHDSHKLEVGTMETSIGEPDIICKVRFLCLPDRRHAECCSTMDTNINTRIIKQLPPVTSG